MSVSPPKDEASVAIRDRVYVDAKRAALWGLGVNLVLVTVKLVGGVLLWSTALIADAVNSIGDIASSLAVRTALHIAEREEDEDHPYGHTKAESLAGFGVALLVFFGASVLAVESCHGIWNASSVPSTFAAVIAAACGIVKEITFQYTSRVAKRLGSSALQATALDHRMDAIASGGIAISLFVAPHLGTFAPYVDPITALCVCILLMVASTKMFLRIATELMDMQASPEVIQQARQIASEVADVLAVEKLRVRKSGLEYFVEIHLQVDAEMTVAKGHQTGHEVKDRLLAKMPRVRYVHLHVEPFSGD